MRQLQYCLVLLTFVISAHSKEASFCDGVANKEFFQQRLSKLENRLAFANPPGPFQTGLCWWHSLLQRNANYLAVFSPDKVALGDKEITLRLQELVRGHAVVEFAGFKNLGDLSSKKRWLIENIMAEWQVSSTLQFEWLKGLSPLSADPNLLRHQMDELFHQVETRKEIVYQVIQIEGIVAHAWLVYKMDQLPTGYKLHVFDSNEHSSQSIIYVRGEYGYWGSILPSTYKNGQFQQFRKAAKNYCTWGLTSEDFRDLESGKGRQEEEPPAI